MLPEIVQPTERSARYTDAIDAALGDLGATDGGGTALADGKPAYSGIDVDVADAGSARAVLRALLPTLGCPASTELHFTRGAERLLDRWDGSGWELDQPRTLMHPAWGV